MIKPGRFAITLAVVVFGIAACTLSSDVDPLKNGECGTGKKACNQQCVTLDSPQTGCALTTCAPCTLANATARCAANGQCTIATCRGGFENCDGNQQNGCETDIGFDAANCGACKKLCDIPNAIAGCTNGVCTVSSCTGKFQDCDKRIENGCESNSDDDEDHCGNCTNKCSAGQRCEAGKCVAGDGG